MERTYSSWDESHVVINPVFLHHNPKINGGSLKAAIEKMNPPDIFAYIPGMGCGIIEKFRRPLVVKQNGSREVYPVTLKPFDDLEIARIEYAIAIQANLRGVRTQAVVGIAELLGDKAIVIYAGYGDSIPLSWWRDDRDMRRIVKAAPTVIPNGICTTIAKMHAEGVRHRRITLDELAVDRRSLREGCTVFNLWCAQALMGADLDAKKCRLVPTENQKTLFKEFEMKALADIVLPLALLVQSGYPMKEAGLVKLVRDRYWLARQEAPACGLPLEEDWKASFNEKYLEMRVLIESGTQAQLNRLLFS